MKPRLITFDAAGTLIEVNWQPGRFAVETALELGIEVDAEPARTAYERLLRTRWTEYRDLNKTRDPERCDEFWREVTRDWAKGQGWPAETAENLIERGRLRLYGDGQKVFRLFDDALPCLRRLKGEGYALAIISNWDYSLHRILRALGGYDFFDLVIASLEEGPEKPEAALFHLVLDRLGYRAEEALHVGDDPLDDLEGARGAGMRGVLIDRSRTNSSPPFICSLDDVDQAIQWTR